MRLSDARRALVVATGKNSAWVSIDGESEPRIAQLRRMVGKRFMPVPGDIAQVRLLETGHAVVDSIEPRARVLARRTAAGRAKTMAANVDLLVIVTALADPPPRLMTLDHLLVFAELEGISAAAVFTKPDLGDPNERDELVNLYGGLGYTSFSLNPKTGENIEQLRALIRNGHAMLVGNSGVGKSTMFRALGGSTAVGEVSRHGLGRQTTTTARLYRIDDGFLIDSPGINEFGLGQLEPRRLARAFPEMRPVLDRCRFADCTHLQEPDCAIAEVVAQGGIAPSRYASYRKMLKEPA